MFIPPFVWFLIVFWCFVYAVHKKYISSANRELLPSGHTAARKPKSWRIELKNFNLKLETSALNSLHENASSYLSTNYTIRRYLGLAYDLGAVFGVLGTLGGILVLGFTSYQTLSNLWAHEDNEIVPLHKRGMVTQAETIPGNEGILVKALIPGVTVPFWHSPILLLALWTAQCIHEMGHAIAAMIESTPLQSVGVSLTLFLPSAFVSIDSSLNTLSPRKRLRVIGAGAWHNLLVWVFIYVLSFLGLTRVWHYLGWEDVTSSGVAVVSVEEDSALAYHVKPGSVIVALDDVGLSQSSTPPLASWEDFFDNDKHASSPPSLGWCVDAVSFFEQISDCCTKQASGIDSPSPPLVQLSCFVPTSSRQGMNNSGRCIDPVPVLAPMSQQRRVARCSSRSDCPTLRLGSGDDSADTKDEMHPMECVQPTPESQLLRIIILPPPWEDTVNGSERNSQSNYKVVLWSGPKEEVYEQISPGRFRSRFRYLPAGIPDVTALFFDYLATISLALYVFNLFDLPFLDGSHFLHALLDLLGETKINDRDMEILEEGDEADVEFLDLETGISHARSFRRQPNGTRNDKSLRFVIRKLFSLIMQGRNWVRWRKTMIENTMRYSTIALMLVSGVGMIWSSSV